MNDSPFKNCPFVKDLIYSFPTDGMHGIDLGTGGKLLRLMIDKKKIDKVTVNLSIDAMTPYIPSDFPRKQRRLEFIDHYKASELRFFSLYSGIVILKNSCDPDIYYNFLTFSVAYRLMSGKKGIIENGALESADQLVQMFVTEFATLYGPENVSFNIHAFLHFPLLANIHGPIHSFSCYKYENYYMLLRSWIRKPSDYFLQIYTRWSQSKGIAKKKEELDHFGSFKLSNNQKDSCIMMRDKSILIITSKKLTLDGTRLRGKRFLCIEVFFESPINSTALGIFKVSSLSDTIENIEMENIDQKMVMLPFEDSFVVMPLLHY